MSDDDRTARTILPLGAFREFSDFPESSPSIRDAVGRGPGGALQRRAAFYLTQGSHVVYVMGMEPDVLDGEDVFLSMSLRSDGDWFWRSDLAHYVVKYNVWLPPEFLDYAAANMWSAGSQSDEAGSWWATIRDGLRWGGDEAGA